MGKKQKGDGGGGQKDSLLAMLGRGVSSYMSECGGDGGSDQSEPEEGLHKAHEFGPFHRTLEKLTIKQMAYILQNIDSLGYSKAEIEQLGAAAQRLLVVARGPSGPNSPK